MWINMLISLSLAFTLGGIIGYEREHTGRPAGLRTHVLVCVGAALVQITAIDFCTLNKAYSPDPFRLGAQVISGIGFLGAGTIIKEGSCVKGLTTAATLWAVGCVGIAVGTGMYIEGIAATLLLYIGLKGLKKVEKKINRSLDTCILMVIPDTPGRLGDIGYTLGALDINIVGMELQPIDKDIQLELTIRSVNNIPPDKLTEALYKVPGIKSIRII